MNGDTFCPVLLYKLSDINEQTKDDLTIATHNGVDSGIWVMRMWLLRLMDRGAMLTIDDKREFIKSTPGLQISYVECPPFIDIGTPEGLEQAKRELHR